MLKHAIKHSKTDWQRVKQEASQDQKIAFEPKTDPYDPNDEQATSAYLNASKVTVRGPGRPKVSVRRQALTMRMDPDLLEHLRASGKGWQSRLHQLIQDAVSKGKL
ncbi:MAG TPA: BrnA antitoxin family protein [Candidimonas sp.]|nr:BrnA antitoxin family protein [Candidimonas sp.]